MAQSNDRIPPSGYVYPAAPDLQEEMAQLRACLAAAVQRLEDES